MKSGGFASVATAALVATIAGAGGTLPIILAAAQAVGDLGQFAAQVAALVHPIDEAERDGVIDG